MTVELQQILAEFRSGLEVLYGPRLVDVVLFGSQARNDASADSDIDVMIVLRGTVDSNQEIPHVSPLASRLSLEHDVVISCVYISEEGFRRDESPLLLNVRREGVLV
jgi:predicted nucleotidyltransferase